MKWSLDSESKNFGRDSILAKATDMGLAKTDTSFFPMYWDIYWHDGHFYINYDTLLNSGAGISTSFFGQQWHLPLLSKCYSINLRYYYNICKNLFYMVD